MTDVWDGEAVQGITPEGLKADAVSIRKDVTDLQAWRRDRIGIDKELAAGINSVLQQVEELGNKVEILKDEVGMLRGAIMDPDKKPKKRKKLNGR